MVTMMAVDMGMLYDSQFLLSRGFFGICIMHLLTMRFEEIYGEVVAACRIASMYYWDTFVMGDGLWAMR